MIWQVIRTTFVETDDEREAVDHAEAVPADHVVVSALTPSETERWRNRKQAWDAAPFLRDEERERLDRATDLNEIDDRYPERWNECVLCGKETLGSYGLCRRCS